MDWQEYFERAKGTGLLATANAAGDVDVAVYSRPRVLGDGTLAFGMTDRLTHANLRENPKAVYAFQERGFQGVRLYLEKVREEEGGPVLEEVRRRADELVGPGTGARVRYLVSFRIVKSLALVGADAPADDPLARTV